MKQVRGRERQKDSACVCRGPDFSHACVCAALLHEEGHEREEHEERI